jgi:lipid-A-disaccharide synthase
VTGPAAPRLFLIAGEPSGDRLGGALLEGLRSLCGPGLRVEGVGGPAMAAQGLLSRFPMEELSVMGAAEVLPRLPRLLRRIRETADAVVEAAPDALVTIDSPDFCLRVAARVRRRLPAQRVIHYVAPSVWAWRPGRAAKMARHVDHVLALLPFEPPLMEAAGMTCDFVGHPVAQTPVPDPAAVAALRAEHGIADGARLALLLPGSRAGEVTRLGPVFAEVARRLRAADPGLAILVPAAAPVAAALAGLMPPDADGWPRLLDPRGRTEADGEARKRAAFAAADVALAASGTVSLELAAAGTPMVIAYAMNPISAWIARRVVRLETVTLVNLVTGTRHVPEYLLGDCTPERITPAVELLLSDPGAAAAQRAAGAEAMAILGRDGAPPGVRAARSVLDHLG